MAQGTLPKWYQIYPQGTTAGDEEQRFFRALSRHPKYDWRSVASISVETNLSKKRVEEIIKKYYGLGMVFQNPKNEDQWGYWENHKSLVPKPGMSISARDVKNRLGDVADGDDKGVAKPKKKSAAKATAAP